MTIIIVPLYRYINNKLKGIWNSTKVAKERIENLSNHDEVGGNLIALDSKRRKLLYIKRGHRLSCSIIDLNSLERCTIQKQYTSINAGGLNRKKMSDYLKSIFLHLRFKNNSGAVFLPLYEAHKNRAEDIEQLEAKARKWQMIVSKLLPIQLSEESKKLVSP